MIYDDIKAKQKARESAEQTKINKKRKHIVAMAGTLSAATHAQNLQAEADGLPTRFRSPTRVVSTVIPPSPAFRNLLKGRRRACNQETFASYEANVEWREDTKHGSKSGHSSVKVSVPMKTDGKNTKRMLHTIHEVRKVMFMFLL